MCGILGVATTKGRGLSVDARTIERMRDTMRHRGPDGAGLWVHEHVALAHRRLVVVDPSDAASQPMLTADGRYAITYNGELYNDAGLRAELAAEGICFRTVSDTETVLAALAAWGSPALSRLRGMYALGLYDRVDRTLLLARDPLGIKPLYYALAGVSGGEELVFASEPRAVLAHPAMQARPDFVAVSAYLTTIRTVMGTRTLFDGVRTLRPGQAMVFELGRDRVEARPLPIATRRVEEAERWSGEIAAARVRGVIEDSVRRHLRSDVPVCCLLSGGLDSSIVAEISRPVLGELFTYCSGAREGERGDAPGDFSCARLMSERLGTRHIEAPVSREMFGERWLEMVEAMGVPLSTPNEVAINEVARRLRADGKIVALSGEGADELFGGYEAVVRAAAEFEALSDRGAAGTATGTGPADGGQHQLDANAWTPIESKAGLLQGPVWRAVEQDHALREFYRVEFEARRAELARPELEARDPLERLRPHLGFQRRINLAGLLQRLDSAMMLEGVEGRTPFADVEICGVAESLPMREKAAPPKAGNETWGTKLVLRRAFDGRLPREVLDRPKASFPLPFQKWMADSVGVLRGSALLREVFTEAAIEMVAQRPGELWRFAWPMINIAMWGKVCWG